MIHLHDGVFCRPPWMILYIYIHLVDHAPRWSFFDHSNSLHTEPGIAQPEMIIESIHWVGGKICRNFDRLFDRLFDSYFIRSSWKSYHPPFPGSKTQPGWCCSQELARRKQLEAVAPGAQLIPLCCTRNPLIQIQEWRSRPRFWDSPINGAGIYI